MAGFVTINNQKIAWSFIMRIRKELGGDYERTVDLFWRAREADDVFGYVRRCMARDKTGRLSITPSQEREEGKMAEVWRWWQGLRDHTRVKTPSTFAEILRDMAAGKQ